MVGFEYYEACVRLGCLWLVSALTVRVGVGHLLVCHDSRCGVVHLFEPKHDSTREYLPSPGIPNIYQERAANHNIYTYIYDNDDANMLVAP